MKGLPEDVDRVPCRPRPLQDTSERRCCKIRMTLVRPWGSGEQHQVCIRDCNFNCLRTPPRHGVHLDAVAPLVDLFAMMLIYELIRETDSFFPPPQHDGYCSRCYDLVL